MGDLGQRDRERAMSNEWFDKRYREGHRAGYAGEPCPHGELTCSGWWDGIEQRAKDASPTPDDGASPGTFDIKGSEETDHNGSHNIHLLLMPDGTVRWEQQ